LKDILTDEEIAHPLNEALLQEAEEIKGDRKLLKDRLEKLEETRSSVSESVYQRVRADYGGKMNRTTDRLVSLKKDLESEEILLQQKKSMVEASLKLHAEKIEEATLRHALGEFTADEHNALRLREEKEIDRLEAARKKLEEGLDRHHRLFEGEDLPLSAPASPPSAKAAPAERVSSPSISMPSVSQPSTPEIPVTKAATKPVARASTAPEHTPSPTMREKNGQKPFESLSNPVIEQTAKIRVEDHQTGTDTAIARPTASATPPSAAPMRKASEIAVLENGKVIQTVILDHNIYIGRSPSNDIVLKEPKVSRKHAEIQFVGGKYVLLDLESSNGTFVSGKKIAEYILQPNDEITIGNTKMVFKG